MKWDNIQYICAMAKFTQSYLDKLEEVFKQANYTVRYEKGNFKSGFCILENLHVIVVNKFSTIENKVGFLIEALRQLPIDETVLDEKSLKLFREIQPGELAAPTEESADVANETPATEENQE
jgi:hypothetical protein